MFTRRTVLILGAGASADYGFPTGQKLLLDICRNATPDGPLFRFLIDKLAEPAGDVERFTQALVNSQAPSVDFFLENRKDFERIGKLAIAATLIPYEHYDAFRLTEEQRWYQTLFGLMAQGGLEENNLSVITFNYDRSLEAFLFLALQNSYNLKPEVAEERLRRIKIVHLYGELGDRLIPVGLDRGYKNELRGDWVTAAAKRIKIVHEAKLGEEFEWAKALLCEAGKYSFLDSDFTA